MNRMLKTVLVCLFGAMLAACASRQGPPADVTDANNLGEGHAKVTGLNKDYGMLETDVGPHTGVLATRSFYFPFNSSTVDSNDVSVVKAHGKYLVENPSAKVLVEGNADVRGSREYNMALGQRRADAVSSILRMEGASSDQVRTVSFGAEKPVALGHTEEDYRLNRRADILYTAK